MTHQDWTEQLRDRMADYQTAAPEGLWADIEASLLQPKAKTKALWPRWASVAALVALTAGIGWWLWPRDVQQLPQETAPLVHQQQPRQPDMEPMTLTAEETVAVTPSPRPPVADEPEMIAQAIPVEDAAPKDVPKDAPMDAPKENHGNGSAIVPPHSSPLTSHLSSPSPRRHVLSVGLHANNGLLAYSQSNGVQMSAAMASRYNYSEYLPTRSTEQQEVIWLAGYEEREHHDHPISYGLTLSYPLTRRWSIETGVVYTRLHADFVNIMKQVQINSEQTLHYIGVPLNIQYQVVGGRQWKAYVTAGAEVDWNVKADSKTEGVKTQSRKDDAQWSLGAAVGVEYDIIPQLGIYAEPGLRHYFDNGSQVRSFFKDQPTNWNLQIGIRLNLSK